MFLTKEKNEVSSVNNLGFDAKSDKLSIYIKNNNDCRIEPLGAPASTSAHEECWSCSPTLCFLYFKKSVKVFNSLPVIPFCLN